MEEAESELVSVDAASEDVLLSVEAVPSVVVPSAGVVEEASVPAGAGVGVRLAAGRIFYSGLYGSGKSISAACNHHIYLFRNFLLHSGISGAL